MKRILLVLLAVWMTNCKDSPKVTNMQAGVVTDVWVSKNQENTNEAKLLLETKCYTCHNPKANESNVIAPPMVAVKTRYLKDNTTKKQFADAIWAFVEKPTKEKVKMRGALNRFGVMPYQPFDEKEIRKISDYIFDYQIEEPEWFKKHWEKGHGEKDYHQSGKKMNHASIPSNTSQSKKGLFYAQSTQKVLGKNLMV